MNLFPNRPSLTVSSRFYSLTNMSIDFRHSFCHSKRVFVRHRFVVVGEKNVVDDNYDENYYWFTLNEISSLTDDCHYKYMTTLTTDHFL